MNTMAHETQGIVRNRTMYLEHFHFNEHPFLLTVDTHFLYESKAHIQARAAIGYALSMRDSLVVISGEIGSGKTTLIQDVRDNLDKSVIVAGICQTQLSDEQFLRALLIQFGLRRIDVDKAELLAMTNDYLVEQHAAGKKVLLIVDEAQNLGPRTLEEVRLLTGLETTKEKLLNVILVGQPELNDTLALPNLQQLAQRIRLRFHLHPLSPSETRAYVEHRVKWAGAGDEPLFEPSTFTLIHGYTGGVPRLINIICDMALTAAFSVRSASVKPAHIKAAANRLQWRQYSKSIYAGSAATESNPDSTTTAFKKANGKPRNMLGDAGRLVHSCKNGFVTEYVLDKEYMRIGRTSNCHIRIVDPDVSRAHAQIVSTDEVTCVEDLGSKNGTHVNEKPVSRHVLSHGDVITIGDHHLRYQIALPEQKVAAAGGAE